MTSWSFWLTVSGYGFSILGSGLLFICTPEDVGTGQIPRIQGNQARSFFRGQELEITGRTIGAKQGFGCLLFGMLLQLFGFVAGSR
jgi:hypothetical protein